MRDLEQLRSTGTSYLMWGKAEAGTSQPVVDCFRRLSYLPRTFSSSLQVFKIQVLLHISQSYQDYINGGIRHGNRKLQEISDEETESCGGNAMQQVSKRLRDSGTDRNRSFLASKVVYKEILDPDFTYQHRR